MARRVLTGRRLALGSCLLLLVMPLSCCVCCPTTGTRFEWKYRFRVEVGMTLAEAEVVLGPAQWCERPPETHNHASGSVPVVQGDEFYFWEQDCMEVWVGLRDGKVCGKWFWAPSL